MELMFGYFVLFFGISLWFSALTAQCRPLEYTELMNYYEVSHVSVSPSPAPEAAASAPASSENSLDSVQVFSVLSYGAVGDGETDDTQAFKSAWDSACQYENSAVILVPKHYQFMIQSAIFTGPCKSSLVFQVMLAFTQV